ncbi:MAG: type IV pilin protein [Methylococcaceae bacterium]|nr:MAG: type IV pilin protein [Methylococcaceae bacterium]
MHTGKKTSGFTLIELMITVVIIGILAAIAYPGYQQHLMKTRRADAEGALLQNANFLERYFTEQSCYRNRADNDPNACESGDGLPSLPVTQSPADNPAYELSIQASVSDGTSYTLQAMPIPGSTQENDACGTLTYSNTGVKSADLSSGCW